MASPEPLRPDALALAVTTSMATVQYLRPIMEHNNLPGLGPLLIAALVADAAPLRLAVEDCTTVREGLSVIVDEARQRQTVYRIDLQFQGAAATHVRALMVKAGAEGDRADWWMPLLEDYLAGPHKAQRPGQATRPSHGGASLN